VQVQGFKVDETILAFDEGKRFAFRVDRGNLPCSPRSSRSSRWKRSTAETRVVYRQALEAKSWFSTLVPMMRRQMQRGLEAGLAGLDPWCNVVPERRARRRLNPLGELSSPSISPIIAGAASDLVVCQTLLHRHRHDELGDAVVLQGERVKNPR
jgi:hypothetical protein